MAISDAFEALGGAVGENDDCTFDFDELDGVELGVGTAAFEVVLKMKDSNIELAEEES